MKALELHAYPTRPEEYVSWSDGKGRGGGARRYRRYITPSGEIDEDVADYRAQEKRLSEPELAAEFESARCDSMLQDATGSYWSPLSDTWSHNKEDVVNRVMTLLRFATAPNYEESDA